MNSLTSFTRKIVTNSMDLPIFDLLKRFGPREEPVFTLYMPPPEDDNNDDDKKEDDKKEDDKKEDDKNKKPFEYPLIDD